MRYQRFLASQRMKTDAAQVRNSAGGYVYKISPWDRLRRFLILGSETGTYYAEAQELTNQNVECIHECVAEDVIRFVDELVEFAESGRAPSYTETLLALAVCLATSTGDDRRYASNAITTICRTGSHLLELAAMFTALTGRKVGSSRALTSGFRKWYADRSASELCYQLTKYQRRYGWTQGDLIRVVHPKPADDATQRLYAYLVGKEVEVEGVEGLEYLATKLRLNAANSAQDVVSELRARRATWELVPQDFRSNAEVWRGLLHQGMPMTALLRNLGKLSSLRVFDDRETLHAVC